jgi:hypothetical protein
MEEFLNSGLVWWITVIDLPILSALFWLNYKTRSDAEDAIDKLYETLEIRSSQLREALSAFKLEVAKSYASVTDMRELEMRIVSHLLRIEDKLDRTALKTESLKAQK